MKQETLEEVVERMYTEDEVYELMIKFQSSQNLVEYRF